MDPVKGLGANIDIDKAKAFSQSFRNSGASEVGNVKQLAHSAIQKLKSFYNQYLAPQGYNIR